MQGERLGRYEVRKRLGSGAFATVWLSYDEALDSWVAIKLLADNWAADADVRRRFLEEGRFLRKVKSSHVVTVYDAGELPDGRPYLVMEYADAGTLSDRLSWGRIPFGQAVEVVNQLGVGLAALHERNLVHRDVKPANVLFRTKDEELRAMVGDLGLGKAVDMSSKLTIVGGTPAFVAPEQASAEPVGPASDQYSLAALTFLLLAGRTPYGDASLSAAIERRKPPRVSYFNEAVPNPVNQVLAKGLAPFPEQRFSSVKEFCGEFADAMGYQGETVLAWATTATSTEADVDGDVPGETHPEPTAAATAAKPTVAKSTGPTAEHSLSPPPATRPAGAAAKLAGPQSSRPRSAPQTSRPMVSRPPRTYRQWPRVVAALGLGTAAGVASFFGYQTSEVDIKDSTGTISVSVPRAFGNTGSTQRWEPPGDVGTFAAVAVGSAADWQAADSKAEGVFAGLYPAEKLPKELPGHPECDSGGEGVTDNVDGDDMVTVVYSECPTGTIVERVRQVTSNRLLWVQIKSHEVATANEILDSVKLSGM